MGINLDIESVWLLCPSYWLGMDRIDYGIHLTLHNLQYI